MKNVIIIILATLVLGLGAYLVYDKAINEGNNEVVENKQEEIKNNEVQVENSSYQVLNFYPSSVAVLYNEEIYVNIYTSTIEIDNLFGEGSYQTLVSTRNNYQEYNFDELKVLGAMNETFKGMKLNVSGVKAVYSYANGQALNSNYGIFILKKDGTVYGISLYSLINGKKEVTHIPNLNNIVEFKSENISMGGMVTYAIDNKGNKNNLDDYVPQNYTQW